MTEDKKYVKGYKKQHKAEKREQAESRQAAYDRLSLDAKIKQASGRRGDSKKELARLNEIKAAHK